MVIVEYVDGTDESIEADDGSYQYDEKASLFKVSHNGYYIMIPREFVKSIRVE